MKAHIFYIVTFFICLAFGLVSGAGTCLNVQCPPNRVCKVFGGRRSSCVLSFDTSVCKLPKVTAYCNDRQPNYYYNQATRRCQRLSRGLCSQNRNNFQNWRDCIRICRVSRGGFRRSRLG